MASGATILFKVNTYDQPVEAGTSRQLRGRRRPLALCDGRATHREQIIGVKRHRTHTHTSGARRSFAPMATAVDFVCKEGALVCKDSTHASPSVRISPQLPHPPRTACQRSLCVSPHAAAPAHSPQTPQVVSIVAATRPCVEAYMHPPPLPLRYTGALSSPCGVLRSTHAQSRCAKVE